MGTWGVGPFDNDDAADLIAALVHRKLRPVAETSNDGRAEDGYNEARAVAQLAILAHGTDILGGPDPEVALNVLLRMRRDSGWLAGWRKPKEIAVALDREIAAARAGIRGCKGCRRRLGKTGLAALDEKVHAALAIEVPKSDPWSSLRRLKRRPRRKSKARRHRKRARRSKVARRRKG